ncbi:helix-turn-helix domain-containing protein [uncultured Flavonifractor sp.]|uniref:helix-turn-helix domain-containing protein n=1 Tax=uncultured Flavonifractor sp. TaxID=1193534 RepID=UPI002609B339|nr:helix-turn-helix transcriptional regulator [uncultured Flavonifractor sp.]
MFQDRLKQLRNQVGLSQADFSSRFHVSSGTIAMWETGKRKPDIDTLIRLSDFFHVSVDYLIGHSDYNSPSGLCSDCWSGKNMKAIRIQRGETPEQVSKDTGISLKNYLKYEDATLDPPVFALYRLSDHYCCDIDFLLGRSWPLCGSENADSIFTSPFCLANPDEQRLVEQFRQLLPKQKKSVFSQIDTFLNPEEGIEKNSVHAV